jgi:transposase
VAEQFGVTYRPKGIYGLLRRVRCRPKVPRPIHTKADLQAQEDWKKGVAPWPCGRLE